MSENTVKHEHKQCGGKNIEKMEEIGKTMPVEEEIYDVAELFKVILLISHSPILQRSDHFLYSLICSIPILSMTATCSSETE